MDCVHYTKILRKKGFKITPQRLAILEVLTGERDHPSALNIYKKVSKDQPSISLATVYQTLKLLKDIGHLAELIYGDKGSRFDINPSPHFHIICPICDKLDDYVTDLTETVINQLLKEIGEHPITQRLEFFIPCSECKENQTVSL